MQVADALPGFAEAFAFEEFNEMQLAALPVLLNGTDNVVASAPTASGKTALAELAICRTLADGGKALFIAPMRALTNEKESDWERFESLGYSVYVVTGERDVNPRRAARADILVMTPEKTDSATRKHDTPRYRYISDIDCCVIDEIHLLDSSRRGAVLEVTISRLRRLCNPRFVALSATMENVEDIAEWLDVSPDATFDFGADHRPIPLHADVKTYSNGENAFADKYRRLYRALDLVEPHLRDDGQALIFVSSRQDTVRAATIARDEFADRNVRIDSRGEYGIHSAAKDLSNETLGETVIDGIAFHHAGLSKSDRDLIEEWFRDGTIRLLFSTTTLAWGVNLPARCVVIRDTKHHDPLEGEVDMNPIDVLQMLGRAGRPGYDDVGYGWIIAEGGDADRYRRLLQEGKAIDSRLAEDLDLHLAVEINIGTINSIDDAHEWLTSTFYHVRSTRCPDRYGDDPLRNRLRNSVDRLADLGFIGASNSGILTPTTLGDLTAKFYLQLPTATAFSTLVRDDPSIDSILRTVAQASEFESVRARQSERESIMSVLTGSDMTLDPGERKVLAILRTAMTGSTPVELQSDAWVIRHNALRLLAACHSFADRFATPRVANRVRRVEARVEHGVSADAVGLTAIAGIGPGRASRLASGEIRTPVAIQAAGVDGLIDVGMGRQLAERLVANASTVPIIEIDWNGLAPTIERGTNAIHHVTISTTGGRAKAGIRTTVNDVEMGHTDAVLGSTTVPLGVFGGEVERLTFAIEVAFPNIPLSPFVEHRTVEVV